MKPIIFSTDMVRAILDGRKTQTRRVIKPQTVTHNGPDGQTTESIDEFMNRNWKDAKLLCVACAPYKPGQILWVRETWQHNPCRGSGWPYDYKATPEHNSYEHDTWRPSIHMPRAAARLFLRVKAVRVERLQDVTEEDAMAEGAVYTDFGIYTPTWKASLDGGETWNPARPQQHDGWHMRPVERSDQCYSSARSAFAGFWDKLNAKRGYPYEANPWVWVIEFERTEVPK